MNSEIIKIKNLKLEIIEDILKFTSCKFATCFSLIIS